MTRGILLWLGVLLLCFTVGGAAQRPTSGDSLVRETPAWFDEAKLGILIQWNAASIPAFAAVTSPPYVTPVTSAEALRAARIRRSPPDPSYFLRKTYWASVYAVSMLVPGSAMARYHAEHYGDMAYERFVEQFRDEVIPGWDPQSWADLFARAGARYVVFAARMDDGFLMWPSAHPNPHKTGWQSKRDVVGELTAALRKRGLRSGLYYPGGVDWTFSGLPMNTTVPQPIESLIAHRRPKSDDIPTPQRDYVNAHWRELIERTRPDILWNDYFHPGAPAADSGVRTAEVAFKREVEDLFRYYLARVSDGVINNRFSLPLQSSGQLYTDFVTPEFFTDPEGITGRPKGSTLKWEVNRPIGTSDAYNQYESYMSATELIHLFVDIVARGGNLLMHVSPMGNGAIPWPQAQRLVELGWWLRVNGAAIYGTRPWERMEGMTGEGLEVRYTASKDAVFAILLGTPTSRVVELDLRLDQGVHLALEGWSGRVTWQATPAGVRVELPVMPDERPAVSLRFSPRSGVHPL